MEGNQGQNQQDQEQFVKNLFAIFLRAIQADEENYNRNHLQYTIEDEIKKAIRPHIEAIHKGGDILEASEAFVLTAEFVFEVANELRKKIAKYPQLENDQLKFIDICANVLFDDKRSRDQKLIPATVFFKKASEFGGINLLQIEEVAQQIQHPELKNTTAIIISDFYCKWLEEPYSKPCSADKIIKSIKKVFQLKDGEELGDEDDFRSAAICEIFRKYLECGISVENLEQKRAAQVEFYKKCVDFLGAKGVDLESFSIFSLVFGGVIDEEVSKTLMDKFPNLITKAPSSSSSEASSKPLTIKNLNLTPSPQ